MILLTLNRKFFTQKYKKPIKLYGKNEAPLSSSEKILIESNAFLRCAPKIWPQILRGHLPKLRPQNLYSRPMGKNSHEYWFIEKYFGVSIYETMDPKNKIWGAPKFWPSEGASLTLWVFESFTALGFEAMVRILMVIMTVIMAFSKAEKIYLLFLSNDLPNAWPLMTFSCNSWPAWGHLMMVCSWREAKGVHFWVVIIIENHAAERGSAWFFSWVAGWVTGWVAATQKVAPLWAPTQRMGLTAFNRVQGQSEEQTLFSAILWLTLPQLHIFGVKNGKMNVS